MILYNFDTLTIKADPRGAALSLKNILILRFRAHAWLQILGEWIPGYFVQPNIKIMRHIFCSSKNIPEDVPCFNIGLFPFFPC